MKVACKGIKLVVYINNESQVLFTTSDFLLFFLTSAPNLGFDPQACQI